MVEQETRKNELEIYVEEINAYTEIFKKGVDTDLIYLHENSTEDLLLAAAEEMAEAQQAIFKLLRTRGIGIITPKTEDQAIEMIKEEFADANALLMLSMYKLGFLKECANRHLDKSIKCADRELEKSHHIEMKGRLGHIVND